MLLSSLTSCHLNCYGAKQRWPSCTKAIAPTVVTIFHFLFDFIYNFSFRGFHRLLQPLLLYSYSYAMPVYFIGFILLRFSFFIFICHYYLFCLIATIFVLFFKMESNVECLAIARTSASVEVAGRF